MATSKEDGPVFLEIRLLLVDTPEAEDDFVLAHSSRGYQDVELAIPDLLALESVFNSDAFDQVACDRRQLEIDKVLRRIYRERTTRPEQGGNG